MTRYQNEDESSNPYSWTASREPKRDISFEAAQARAPEAGVPLRRPTETATEYHERVMDLLNNDLIDPNPWPLPGEEDPIGDNSPAGYDAHDFAKDK